MYIKLILIKQYVKNKIVKVNNIYLNYNVKKICKYFD